MRTAQAFKSPLFSVVILTEIVLTMGLAGCMPSHYYTASTLPMELAARPLQSATEDNLSRFAGPSVDNNMIIAGDVLEVSLAAGLSADEIVEFDVRVGDGGETLLPEIGRLPLGGLDAVGAEKMIVAACIQRGLYQHPHVTVKMKEQRKNCITVVGAVKKPGVQELSRGSSNLVAAIMAAGGLEDDAGAKIEIRRPAGPSVMASDTGVQKFANARDNRPIISQPDSAVNVAVASNSCGTNSHGIRQAGHSEPIARDVELVCLNLFDPGDKASSRAGLPDGSIVTVQRLDPEPIEVIGLVRKPDQYDYPVKHEVRLLSAIALAGGVSAKQADKVIVIRRTPDGTGFTGIEASLKKAKQNPADNLRLAPGDVVSVEQTLGTMMADTINFVRFGIGASVPLF